MRVLLAHNYYRSLSPSGEDVVFANEVSLLRTHNVSAATFLRHNDDITRFGLAGKLLLPLTSTWSRTAYRELRGVLKREKPDVCHFHNLFYLLSPSVYSACRDAGVPVVQTLHNFRFFCVNGLLMHEGSVCEKCIGRMPWRGALNGCFRESKLYSLAVAFTEAYHRLAGTWQSKVDAFIALTEFGRRKFIECGLPAEKVFVKPNFLPNPPEPSYSRDGYAIFLGRVSYEKGISTLLEATRMVNAQRSTPLLLKLVGDGPLLGKLKETLARDPREAVELCGRKSLPQCMALLGRARFLVMPSLWFEGFPMVIREAFACGTPVIASRLGAMAELVEDGRTGLLFEPGNAGELAEKMRWMVEHEDQCVEMGKNARAVFEAKYTAEKNYPILMGIYERAMANSNRA